MVDLHKDALPIETVTNIRNALAKMGLLTCEEWKNTGNVYSVSLSVIGTTVTSNGKSTIKEYALASAYGELAERLGLLLPFRLSAFSNIFSEHFVESSFQTRINLSDWLQSKDFLKYIEMLSSVQMAQNVRSLIDGYITKNVQYDWACRFCKVECVEDLTLITNCRATYLPHRVIDCLYGTNGMCAGNTPEEAIIQGISEIIERNTLRSIISNEMNEHYDITKSCMAHHPFFNEFADEVGKEQLLTKVILCSSRIEIPVVAVVLYSHDLRYKVSLGCHPDLGTALERATTELCQGYKLAELKNRLVEEFASPAELHSPHSIANYETLISGGKGTYPIDFILGIHEEKEVQFCVYGEHSNKSILDKLLKKIYSIGLQVLICTGYRLGVHSFHVIIPGFSEAFLLLPNSKLRFCDDSMLYSEIDSLTPSEAIYLAQYCEQGYAEGKRYMTELIGIDKYRHYGKLTTSLDGICLSQITAMLFLKGNCMQEAAKYFSKFICEISPYVSFTVTRYYSCMVHLLTMLANGKSLEKIILSLGNVAPYSELIDLIAGKVSLFSKLPQFDPVLQIDLNSSLKYMVQQETCMLDSIQKTFK